MQVSASPKGKTASRRNKKVKKQPSNEEPVVTIEDIFAITKPALLGDSSGVLEKSDDVITGNYDDGDDYVFEYAEMYEDMNVTHCRSPQRTNNCSTHRTPTQQQVLTPNKWKRSVKRQAEVSANRTAAKQNIEKQLEIKGLQRLGPAVFERAWSDSANPPENKSKKNYTSRRKPRASPRANEDSPAVLRHALQKSDVKKTGTGSHLLTIVDLQHRDITPEDYELLLHLDEDVAPKTVSKDVLDGLETASSDSLGLTGESCSICMEQFKAEELLKKLLCGHSFHSPCVDRWLTFSSCACPLDGLPIVQL